MYYQNKKAVSEITSFVLLTLLIVVVSLSAYTFVTAQIDRTVADFDLKKLDTQFHNLDLLLYRIMAYDGGTESQAFQFKKGLVVINPKNVTYVSLVSFTGNSTQCFDDICYSGVNGYEQVTLNLPSTSSFSNNISLVPGYYLLTFINTAKNGKINVSIK